MKNKKLLGLLLVGVLAGCGTNNSSSVEETSSSTSPVVTSTTSSSTSSTTVEESSSTSSSTVEESSSTSSSTVEESSSESSSTVEESSSESSTIVEESSSESSSTVEESSSESSSTVEESSSESSSTVEESSSESSSTVEDSSTSSSSEEVPSDPYATKSVSISGAFNGWTLVPLTYVGNGTFEITNIEVQVGQYEFVFNDSDDVWHNNNNNNYAVDGPGIYTITFTYNTDAEPTVTYTKTGDVEIIYPSEWYYVGTATGADGGWKFVEEYKLSPVTDATNCYYINVDVNANDIFKVATENWSSELNYSNLDGSAKEYFAAANASGNIRALATGNFTFTVDAVANTLTVVANGEVVLPEVPENSLEIGLWLNDWFSNADAQVYAYWWNEATSTDGWVKMELINDNGDYGDYYTFVIENVEEITGFKVVRFESTVTTPGWDQPKWNETDNITYANYSSAITDKGYFTYYC